ncbi:MAG: UvrD-helicase domain-containing protein [Candidatus Korobacteraceae bacterium]|jgi:ATP-dependent helicase/nuclease subunit A
MNSARAIDEESCRLIRQDLLRNILVEAGAGSGKTQMLADRMAAGVATGVYPLEQLAAVTFTRKAASELRGRFHLALEKERENAQKNPKPSEVDREQISRIESALSNLERFFAGTIHSFCARLLRERPVESGVAPGFTELDETQDLELRQQAWRDFVTSARANGDPDLVALLEADIKPKDLDSAFAIVCTNEDIVFPVDGGVCPDPNPAVRELKAFWKRLTSYLPVPLDNKTKCPVQQKILDFEGHWRVSLDRLNRPSILAALLEKWEGDCSITQKWWSTDRAQGKKLHDSIEELHGTFRENFVKPYLRQWRNYVYCLAIKLLVKARDGAAAERRRVNALNYGDLLNLTARVLRDNPQVRQALQQKYRFLLVDEFQDTDPIQAEILFWLAEDASQSQGKNNADWREVSLRKGALFVVGDPKQSIYRFRRADIDIYNIVRKRFEDTKVGRVLPLTRNFRSGPRLCNWANDVFKTRFPETPTAQAPRFSPLDPESKQDSGGVFTLTHGCDAKEVQEQDAEKIASYIRAEVDAGLRKFSDFLILTRKKRNRIAPYAHALEALNIPIEVSGAGAFGDSPAVQALTALLRALSDPQDPVSLIAVLRGPFFGISDPELFAFKQAAGRFSVFHEADGATKPDCRVSSALSVLRQYYRWTRLLPAPAALDRILEHSGYLALAATSPGGVDAGDVLHAVDRVRQITECGGSLAEAADALEADAEAASEVESLPLAPGRTEVVRIMNLHKAKGLEANVVLLADPAGGVPQRVNVRIERSGLSARGWLKVQQEREYPKPPKLLAEPADWQNHEDAELPYLQAEEDRLLYVAATRAREVLVVSRCTKKNTAWGVLNEFLTEAKELTFPAKPTVAPVQPLECGKEAQAAAENARTASLARLREPSWSISSVTAEARQIARMVRSVEVASDDPSKVVSTDTPTHRADAGHAWGTLIHGLLEHAMRHKGSTYSDLYRLAMWLSMEEPDLRSVLEQAVRTVLEVSKAEIWQKAEQSEHSVETPFTYAADKNQLITGVIDLMFKQLQSWHILDYKTDLDVADQSASYAEQLKMYERALAAIGIAKASSQLYPVRLTPTK